MSFSFKARIENNIVTNILIVDDNWQIPEDWNLINIDNINTCAIGDKWDGHKFSVQETGESVA